MQDLRIGNLVFSFHQAWSVSRYDDWTFYKRKFQSMCGGNVKGVDLLAISPDQTAWLIEVKDYRTQGRTKIIDLPSEMADKAFDTLAGLLPVRVASEVEAERAFVHKMHASLRLRIVLHVEQPKKNSRLFPRAIRLADVQQKLRTLVRPVDAHAIVCESLDLRRVAWEVRSAQAHDG